MKINKIKIGLIALVLCALSVKTQAADINLCLDSFQSGAVLTTAEQNMSTKDLIAGCAEFGGIFVGAVIVLGVANYLKNVLGVADPTLTIKNYNTIAANYINENKLSMSPADLDIGASLQVVSQINMASDKELGYESGKTAEFMQKVMTSGGKYTDALDFVSSSVGTLSSKTVVIGASSTKLTLPDQYTSFTDYLIKNNITTTTQLNDLITQASARENGGLLPQEYEPSVSSGPSAPSAPVGPKIPDTQYQQLQDVITASRTQLSSMIENYNADPESSLLMNYRTLLIQQYETASAEQKAQAQKDIDDYNAQLKEANITDSGVTIEQADL